MEKLTTASCWTPPAQSCPTPAGRETKAAEDTTVSMVTWLPQLLTVSACWWSSGYASPCQHKEQQRVKAVPASVLLRHDGKRSSPECGRRWEPGWPAFLGGPEEPRCRTVPPAAESSSGPTWQTGRDTVATAPSRGCGTARVRLTLLPTCLDRRRRPRTRPGCARGPPPLGRPCPPSPPPPGPRCHDKAPPLTSEGTHRHSNGRCPVSSQSAERAVQTGVPAGGPAAAA